MKRFIVFLFLVVLIISVSIGITACSGDKEVTLSSIDFENQSVIVKYNDQVGDDLFKVSLVYSDGTKVSISDLSEEELAKFTVTITKHNPDTNQDEEWDFSQKMTYGSYTITYSYGGLTGTAALFVDKADYDRTPSIQIAANQMTYGAALAKPTVSFNADKITNIVYYYQHKTADNSYADMFFTYDYSDNAICDITPGEYQLYAVFETENYNSIKTSLTSFKVNTAVAPGRYGIFIEDNPIVDPETGVTTYDYVPFSGTYDMTFDFAKTNVSEYIQTLYSLHIIEVDENDAIIYNEEGDPSFRYAIGGIFGNENSILRLASSDTAITAPARQLVRLAFTPNIAFYQPIYFNLNLRIQKLIVDVDNSLAIALEDGSSIDGEVPFTGFEYHLTMPAIQENGQYYGYISNFVNGQEILTKIYTISNYARSDAGTYTVVCTVLPELTDIVDLQRIVNSVTTTSSSFNLGNWTITKKHYNIDADITLNGKDISQYEYNGNTTFIYGNDYTFAVSNIVASYESTVDSSVNPQFSSIKVQVQDQEGNWIDNTTGITINNTTSTISIASDCPYEYAKLLIKYDLNNSNYEGQTTETYIYFKHAAYYDALYGTPMDNSWDYTLVKADSYIDPNFDYYVSSDNCLTKNKWSAVRNTLYYKVGLDYELNTDSTIDTGKEYYEKISESYHRVYFYYPYVEEKYNAQVINNAVCYDGKAKTMSGILALTGFEVESWDDIKDSVYTRAYDDDIDDYVYTLNTSATLDFSTYYFKKVGDDYIELSKYYQIGSGYVCTSRPVEGITDYYFAPVYHDVYEYKMEKKNGDNWEEVYFAKGVGTYRTIFRFNVGDRVLIDSQGNYLSEIYYEWSIVDNLTHIDASNINFVITDKNGDTLTLDANNTITIVDGKQPIKVTINGTLNSPVDYAVVLLYDSGSLNCSPEYNGIELNEEDSYTINAYFVFDGDYCITDANDNVIEYVTLNFELVIDQTA